MINLIPLDRAIAVIAIFYAIIIAILQSLLHGSSMGLWKTVFFMASGSTSLILIVSLLFSIGWRWIWKKIPILNRLLFPDLNGTWDMEIQWNNSNGTSGIKNAKATIVQTFLKISMEVDSEDSDSSTIVAKPKKDQESGRPILFYAYTIIPHKKGPQDSEELRCYSPYEGMANLKLSQSNINELRGNYFTSIESEGHFTLRRSVVKEQ